MLSSASNLTKKAVNFFFSIKITSKKQVETTSIFRSSKLHQKQYVKKTWILHPPKLCYKKVVKKYMETMSVFNHRNYVKKSTWKQRAFFEKARGNYVEIFQNLVVST